MTTLNDCHILKIVFTIYFILFFLMMIIVTSTSSISQFLHIRNIGYHTVYSPRYNLSHLMLSPPLLYFHQTLSYVHKFVAFQD